jgi:alpha-aminoadipic semialdehyde synthase
VAQSAAGERHKLYKVVFKEAHLVEPLLPEQPFDLQDYYDSPEKYRSVFHTYLPHLNILVNCIYWEEKYPRLVTKADLRQLYGGEGTERPRLQVIGDISCDVEGAVEATVKCTEPGDPVFVYDPFTGETPAGVAGRGPVILAVDILPSELPRDASEYFSGVLMDYIPAVAQADYTVPFDELALPPEIKRAVIVYQGELTPDYRYLAQYLDA